MGRRWGSSRIAEWRPTDHGSVALQDSGGHEFKAPRLEERPREALHREPADKRPARAAAGSGELCAAADVLARRGQSGSFKVWWIEKGGTRREQTLDVDGPLPELGETAAAAEYRLRIRAIYLRAQGWSRDRVAKECTRDSGWVSTWWERPPEAVPRPWDVPPYVADYNLRMLGCGVEPFRPAVLRRRYVAEPEGIYAECAQQMPWRQAIFRKRNYKTGEVVATGIPSSRQDCHYPGLRTGIAKLDEALDRIRREFDVRDPKAFLLNNFYPDGNTSIAPHQHDFWSAILSFGASRVFTVDGTPILLGDGDLLVFGTQRHGVPKMPAVTEGRVSVAIFWYPEYNEDSLQAEGVCAQCGQQTEEVQQAEDGRWYCWHCWQQWRLETSAGDAAEQEDEATLDDDLMAVALEMSLKDY